MGADKKFVLGFGREDKELGDLLDPGQVRRDGKGVDLQAGHTSGAAQNNKTYILVLVLGTL